MCILRPRSSGPVDCEITSQTQSGGSSMAAHGSRTGLRERRHPARSGTSTSRPTCNSGSTRIHQPPGPAELPGGRWKALFRSPPIADVAAACGTAGRGLTTSSPSISSATRVSGTFARSSYVAERRAIAILRTLAPLALRGDPRAIPSIAMPPRTSRAIVQTGPAQPRLRELPVPELTDDTALLRVEACGICGSDAEQYTGTIPVRYPLVPGHEPLGVIEAIGDRAAQRWGVDVGDRVAVESLIPCGHCPACRGGRYQVCRGRGGGLFGHGYVPLDRAPGLWGAYADYMYLDACSIVHRIRADLPANIAVLFNPLGAGFRWAVEMPGTGPGDSVLILGPGQRGLASVIAARAAGADRIIVTGLARDAAKLALARRLVRG